MGELEIEFKVKSPSTCMHTHSYPSLSLSRVHPSQPNKNVCVLMLSSLSLFSLSIAAVKYRHKSHLAFSFGESQESNNMVVQASLNLFVHSRKYLLANNVRDAANLKSINVEVAEILSGEKHKWTFGVFENITVPEYGEGVYVQLNVTELIDKWFHHHENTHGLNVKVTSGADGSKVPNKVVVLDAEDLIKVRETLALLCAGRTMQWRLTNVNKRQTSAALNCSH
jgi:hypothetical protein